jgi:hypothetical protein
MSEMSMQEKEYKIAELLEVSKQYSEAEATRQYLMEFRKSKKAILMAQAEREAQQDRTAIPLAKQERYAYAHPEYIELLDGLKVAIERAVYLKHQILAINMRFEQWRSMKATQRAEMNYR